MQQRHITAKADFLTREVDGRRVIEGYFAVFGGRYDLWKDCWETIDRGAFDLETDKDVRCLTNHDTTLVLGRTTAGTLALRVDEKGLFGSVEINNEDQDAVNTFARVKRGDVTQCSFGFDIIKEMREETPNGEVIWHIQGVKLYEVSVCTFPAYTETGVDAVEMRKKQEETAKRRKVENWRAKALKKLKGEKKDAESNPSAVED